VRQPPPPPNAAPIGSITLPDIPRPQVLPPVTFPAPITLLWDDSLGDMGEPGIYRLLLSDGVAEWEIWAGASAAPGTLLLPELRDAFDIRVTPLSTLPGATWTLRVQAFDMKNFPGGFTEGTDWFFTDLQAELHSWAESASEEVLTFE